jgi:hypothetical protein
MGAADIDRRRKSNMISKPVRIFAGRPTTLLRAWLSPVFVVD